MNHNEHLMPAAERAAYANGYEAGARPIDELRDALRWLLAEKNNPAARRHAIGVLSRTTGVAS